VLAERADLGERWCYRGADDVSISPGVGMVSAVGIVECVNPGTGTVCDVIGESGGSGDAGDVDMASRYRRRGRRGSVVHAGDIGSGISGDREISGADDVSISPGVVMVRAVGIVESVNPGTATVSDVIGESGSSGGASDVDMASRYRWRGRRGSVVHAGDIGSCISGDREISGADDVSISPGVGMVSAVGIVERVNPGTATVRDVIGYCDTWD
jgi:hypothetical protein